MIEIVQEDLTLTQIKKLAWYGSSVALAGLMAFAIMLASSGTAFAELDNVSVDGGGATGTIQINEVVDITVETDNDQGFVRATIDAASTGAVEFVGGQIQQAANTNPDVATFTIVGTAAGQVIINFRDLADNDLAIAVVTVQGATSVGAATALDIHLPVGEDGIIRSASAADDDTGIQLAVRAEDANGNLVTTGTFATAQVLVTTSHGTLEIAATACGGATSQIISLVGGTANVWLCPSTATGTAAGSGDAVITASVVGGGIASATETVTVGAAPASINVTLAGDISLSSPATLVTAEVLDADGRKTTGTVTFSAGPSTVCAVIPTTAVNLSGGTGSATLVVQGASGTCVVTAVSGAAVGTATEAVGQAGQPGPGTDTGFEGTIATSGVSIVSFNGGTVADLIASAQAAGLTSVSVTVDGDFVVLIPGAPAFVNAAFNAAFADGVPEGTLAIVVR